MIRPKKTAHNKKSSLAAAGPRKKANGRARGRPAKRKGGAALRDRILDAAEELFAARGFDGVTVRQVTAKAKVDVALSPYYFGTKRGLFDTVFLRRAAMLNERHLKSVEDYLAAAGPKGVTVEGILQAFLDPVLDCWANGGRGWKNYLALVARANNTRSWDAEMMARYVDTVVHRLMGVLRGLMPGAREEDLFWSYHFLSAALTLTLAETGRIDRLSGGLCKSSDYQAVRKRMSVFLAAGFRAVCMGKKAVPSIANR